MAFLEGRLRSSEFPYESLMRNRMMNQNEDLQRELLRNQVEQQNEKLRQEKMKTLQLKAEYSPLVKSGREKEAQRTDPGQQQLPYGLEFKMDSGTSNPSDVAPAIRAVSGVSGVDPNTIYNRMADTYSDAMRMGGGGGGGMRMPAEAPVSVGNQQGGAVSMADYPALQNFMENDRLAQLQRARQKVADTTAQGKVDAAKIESESREKVAGTRAQDKERARFEKEAVQITPEEEGALWSASSAEHQSITDKTGSPPPITSIYHRKKLELESEKKKEFDMDSRRVDETTPEYTQMADDVYSMAPDMYLKWSQLSPQDRVSAYKAIRERKAMNVLQSAPIIGGQ